MPRQKFVSWGLASVCAAVLFVSAAPQLIAQDPPPPQDPPAADATGRGGRQGGGANQAPRPYASVITSAFKTDDGVFKVHRGPVNGTDSVLFEIPQAELGKDFVWDVSIKKTTVGVGFGGQSVSNRVVRWVKRGDRLLLQGVDYSITSADPSSPVNIAVSDANYPSIIRTLPVMAYSSGGDPVVDVTPLVMEGGVPEFSARGAVGGRGIANDRSFLEKAVSFPDNVNIEVTLTFTGADTAGGGGGGRGGGGGGGMRGASGTVLVHHSVMKLPEKPMMERFFDERVGYDSEGFTDFGTDEHRSVRERVISRPGVMAWLRRSFAAGFAALGAKLAFAER